MTFPANVAIKTLGFRMRSRNLASEARSGRRQSRNISEIQWEWSIQTREMTRAEFAPLMAYMAELDGSANTDDILLPHYSYHHGDVSGSPAVSGAVAAGSRTVPVDGFAGTIPVGDFVAFPGHRKTYLVTEELTGPGVLSIKPGLVQAVVDNEALTIDQVPFYFRQGSDSVDHEVDADRELFSYEIPMVEDA